MHHVPSPKPQHPFTQWTRRHFLTATTIATGALLGGISLQHHAGDASIHFTATRARPGQPVSLDLQGGRSEHAHLVIVRRLYSPAPLQLASLILALDHGAGQVEWLPPPLTLLSQEIPDEATQVSALWLDERQRLCAVSPPIEVVISPFSAGI